MELKRVLVKYENLSQELKEIVNEKFPFGVEEDLMKVPKGKNDFFYAFTFDHGDTRYMVKVSEGTVMLDDMLEDDDADNLTAIDDGSIAGIDDLETGDEDEDDDNDAPDLDADDEHDADADSEDDDDED